jgi:hypothetical protein
VQAVEELQETLLKLGPTAPLGAGGVLSPRTVPSPISQERMPALEPAAMQKVELATQESEVILPETVAFSFHSPLFQSSVKPLPRKLS